MAGYNGPSSADPFGGFISNATGAGQGTSSGDSAFNNISQGMTLGMGGNLFGDQNQPGLLGMGRYQVNPSGFGPTATSAESMFSNAGAAGNRNVLDPTAQNQAQDQQNQLIQMLMAQANGTGPNIAQDQLKQATDRNVQQTMGMMASQRGAGAGASAYQAANAGGQAGQQMAADSATLRSQQQLAAQQQLGGVLGTVRGQDQSWQQTGLQQQQMNDQLVQFYTSQGMSIEQANRQAQMAEQQMKMQAYQGSSGSGGGSGALAGIGGLISAL